MIRTRDVAPRALGTLLRDQPLSAGKVRLAWVAAVGASMARATSVSLQRDGTLSVRVDTEHWRREAVRSIPMIQQRLADLLGRNVVKKIAVVHAPRPGN